MPCWGLLFYHIDHWRAFKQSMTVQIYTLSLWQAKGEGAKFEASFGYMTYTMTP